MTAPRDTTTGAVARAYADRSAEYIAHLGSIASVHPADEHLVRWWAAGVDGRIMDAGCGPGHWSAHLAGLGHDVRGVDPTPEFVDHARVAAPSVRFEVGSFEHLTVPDGDGDGVDGVLAWYSLIHHAPDRLDAALGAIARVLRPGGGLLVGCFVGAVTEPFAHAVTTAWRWAPDELTQRLGDAGFAVDEVHTRTGPADGPRPHGAFLAHRAVPRVPR